MELDVAMPARHEVASAMSYWMKYLAQTKGITYASVQAGYESEPACPRWETASQKRRSGVEKLTITSMSGPLIVAAAFMFAAITTWMVRTKLSKRAKRRMRRAVKRLSNGKGEEEDKKYSLRTRSSASSRESASRISLN